MKDSGSVDYQIDNKQAFVATGNRGVQPGRESILFIHGAGQDHTIWVRPKRYFARHGCNVLDLDLPGHGYSEGPALNKVEEMANWVIRVMDAGEIPQAILIGHSLGSLVALDTAARYPDRAVKLVMIGTSVPMPVGEELLQMSSVDDHDALEMMTLWGHSNSAHLGGCSVPGMWMLGMGLRLFEQSESGVMHVDLNACNNYVEGLARAAKVKCETLLVLGERDLMTPPRAAAEVAKTIPNSRTVLLPGSGHALLAERPEEVLTALAQFVSCKAVAG